MRARVLPDGQPQLEVGDQGKGLDRSQHEKVYNMFYSERTHGAGIGLALVRQIVDAHGATIEIESEQQKGATFIVTLPKHAPRTAQSSRDCADTPQQSARVSPSASRFASAACSQPRNAHRVAARIRPSPTSTASARERDSAPAARRR